MSKKLEDVLTSEVLKKIMEQDPNLDLNDTVFTEKQRLVMISQIRAMGLEDEAVKLLDGRDLDKNPLQFFDFKLKKTQ